MICQKLNSLQIDTNENITIGMALRISKLGSLDKLNLSYCQISSDILSVIVNKRRMRDNLSELSLMGCKEVFTRENTISISNFKNLKKLNLKETQILGLFLNILLQSEKD
ncbi:hypothetical protein DMUE_5526 [Dictyocoela muelleri]|nr:hypothetical protein DMUE_5526 [Dictyocoela muelleri]